MELIICPKCGKLMYNVNNICPHCDCNLIRFNNPELENVEFEIICQERPNKWKYIYFVNNEKKVISASTKPDLKDKVLSKGLIWDESKIKGVSTINSMVGGEGFHIHG